MTTNKSPSLSPPNRMRRMSRRALIKTATVAGSAIAGTGITGLLSTAIANSSGSADNSYPKYYFPYHNKPATVVDFGLTPEQEDRARALHSKLFVFDFEPEVDWFEGLFDNMLAGKAGAVGGSFTIDAFYWALVHGFEENLEITKHDWWTMKNIRENVEFIRGKEQTEGKSIICLDSTDLEKAAAAGKVAMMLDCQNSFYIGNQLDNIDEAYDHGIRRTQLAYNRGGGLASGCMDPRDGGLKVFGQECIGRMNDIGMLVDVGHSSPLTMLDALHVSEKPISCSHAGLRSISPKNPRTHTDEGLRGLADHGGVLGVVGSPSTFGPELPQNSDVPAFLNCIDYAINLMGEDSVGFALDQVQALSMKEFLTSPDWPPEAVASVNVDMWPWSDGFKGMENHSGYPNLTRGMVSMGYSDERIMKVMGGNHMRLIKEVIG